MPVVYPYVIRAYAGWLSSLSVEVERGEISLFDRPYLGETVKRKGIPYKVVDVEHEEGEKMLLVLEAKDSE